MMIMGMKASQGVVAASPRMLMAVGVVEPAVRMQDEGVLIAEGGIVAGALPQGTRETVDAAEIADLMHQIFLLGPSLLNMTQLSRKTISKFTAGHCLLEVSRKFSSHCSWVISVLTYFEETDGIPKMNCESYLSSMGEFRPAL